MAEERTPEEIAEARAIVAEAEAADAAAARASARASVQDLTELGFGVDTPVEITMRDVVEGIRAHIPQAVTAPDRTLLQLLNAAANVLQTLDDRVRSILVQNQEPPSSS